jgi:hypothetical protein
MSYLSNYCYCSTLDMVLFFRHLKCFCISAKVKLENVLVLKNGYFRNCIHTQNLYNCAFIPFLEVYLYKDLLVAHIHYYKKCQLELLF